MIDRDALDQERGRLTWPEVERHFARGVVVVVEPALDLLDVAVAMARDDREAFSEWLSRGLVGQAQDRHARRWAASLETLEAIVVAPWVLVSETFDVASAPQEQ